MSDTIQFTVTTYKEGIPTDSEGNQDLSSGCETKVIFNSRGKAFIHRHIDWCINNEVPFFIDFD